MKKLTAYISLVLFVFTVFLFSVHAQSSKLYNAADDLQAPELTAEEDFNKCEITETLLGDKIKLYSILKPQHVAKYQTLHIVLVGFAKKADAMGYGYEPGALLKNTALLQQLINEYDTASTIFIKNLENTKNFACNKNPQYFANSLETTKKSLEVVRNSTAEIYNYYNDSMKVLIDGMTKSTELDGTSDQNSLIKDDTNEQ